MKPEPPDDPYYYCREYDGSGWSVRGPDGFVLKMRATNPMDKNIAYCIAKLLSGKLTDADDLLQSLIHLGFGLAP
jgi:hypothetical protein